MRAKQHFAGDVDRKKNLGVLLHGDGAFSGQGVVFETLDMSALPDYTVGGTIHLIVNNPGPQPTASCAAWVDTTAGQAVSAACRLKAITNERTRSTTGVFHLGTPAEGAA